MTSSFPTASSRYPEWSKAALLALAALALYWANARHPAAMPVWAPWDFSWPVFVTAILSSAWYWRGLARVDPARRPRPWRRASFALGVASIYAVTQTHFDFYAQHVFYIHRAQHIVLHHLGPFLIALGSADEVLLFGMPAFLAPLLRGRIPRRCLAIVQHPVIAPVLFVGLIYFWLVPAVHFRAMIDARAYAAMNWSMALDGILFWSMILDPRPKPPARSHHLTRALLVILIAPPQILLGALLTFSSHDLFPVYEICGRILPLTALEDQHLGGLILWIPGAMMSIPALIAVLSAMRLSDESKTDVRKPNPAAPSP